jgi:hypothetical protein
MTRTRKIHARDPKNFLATMCERPTSRRYCRSGNESAAYAVNCQDCLRVLVDTCDYKEFLRRAGFAKIGPHGLPVKECKRCDGYDEFTSESEAHGICAGCMASANQPDHP